MDVYNRFYLRAGYINNSEFLFKEKTKEDIAQDAKRRTDSYRCYLSKGRLFKKTKEALLKTHNKREMSKFMKYEDYEPDFLQRGMPDFF